MISGIIKVEASVISLKKKKKKKKCYQPRPEAEADYTCRVSKVAVSPKTWQLELSREIFSATYGLSSPIKRI